MTAELRPPDDEIRSRLHEVVAANPGCFVTLFDPVTYGTAVLFVDLDGFKQINDTHGHGIGGVTLQPRASVGVSWTPESYAAAETLLLQADEAMYRAKREGGGRAAAFTSDTTSGGSVPDG